jgi:hypothetical protein
MPGQQTNFNLASHGRRFGFLYRDEYQQQLLWNAFIIHLPEKALKVIKIE